MKKLVKFDLLYFLKSKMFILFSVLLVLFTVLISGMTYSYEKTTLDMFKNSLEFVQRNGDSVEEELEQTPVVHENGVVENPLSYYNEVICNVLKIVSPQNCLSTYFENCSGFMPIVAILIASVLLSYDEKYRTRKLKAARNGNMKYYCSKQISGLLILFIMLIIGFIFSFAANSIVVNVLESKHDLSMFTFSSTDAVTVLKQGIFTLVSGVIYFEIAYILCNLTHAYTVIAVLSTLIVFFLPPIFKYDPLNIRASLNYKFFDYVGVIHPGSPIKASFTALIIEGIIILLVLFIVNHIVSKKRSAYN